MFPTCSNRLFAGRNALSATRRYGSGGHNGHPPETRTRHQLMRTPSGPKRGADSQVVQPGSPISGAETDLRRGAPRGSAIIASRSDRARCSRRDGARPPASRAEASLSTSASRIASSSPTPATCGSAAARAAARPASRPGGRGSRRPAPPRRARSARGGPLGLRPRRSTARRARPRTEAPTWAATATSRGSTPAARAARIASAAIRSISDDPPTASATKLPAPWRVSIEPVALEAGVDRADGVDVDAAPPRQLPDARHPRARREPARADQRPQPPGELDADRELVGGVGGERRQLGRDCAI